MTTHNALGGKIEENGGEALWRVLFVSPIFFHDTQKGSEIVESPRTAFVSRDTTAEETEM